MEDNERRSAVDSEDSYPAFSYGALSKHFLPGVNRTPPTDPHHDYRASFETPENPLQKERHFILMTHLKTSKASELKDMNAAHINFRLKFHISLPENEPELFSAGWNIIKTILIQNEVGLFKIVRPGEKMSSTPGQAGKDITIYAYDDKQRSIPQWCEIFESIIEKLVRRGIPPGYRVKNDEYIDTTCYISYRYEGEKTGYGNNAKYTPPKEDVKTYVREMLTIRKMEDEQLGYGLYDDAQQIQLESGETENRRNCPCAIV